jgi:2-hydroxy-3-oxopropionate reductase
MNLGFIGLGIMGRPMALNLRKAGYPLWVHGRRPVTMEVLVEAGARPCGSAREVAEHADVVFIMVTDTPDVEEVVLGDNGLIHGLRPGSVVVDMSTIAPSAARRLAAALATRGVDMLDAPVSGGERGAIEGTLSIMVGGKPEVFERLRPLLEILGKHIVHVGDHGAGQVAKACNQLIVGVTIAAVAEAFTLARSCGVDPARVREALLGGFAGSRILEVHGARMLEADFRPGFKARLHQKDLRIVRHSAAERGLALPMASLAAELMNALVGGGDGELDSSALVKVIERLNALDTGGGPPPSVP